MAVLIDKEDLNWKLQDMPGTGYEVGISSNLFNRITTRY